MSAGIIAIGLVVLLLLGLSALFSAAETSLTGASRGRMHQLEREGDRAAGRVNRLISDQETMMGSVLLGNNLLNIFASALTTVVMTKTIPLAIVLLAGAFGIIFGATRLTQLILGKQRKKKRSTSTTD